MRRRTIATLAALTAVALGVAVPASPAVANQTERSREVARGVSADLRLRLSTVAQTQAQNRQQRADSVTYPRPGEGMIRVTTRICGTANTWQAQAARNNVVPPTYLVLLGQRLTITCTGATPATIAAGATPSGWVAPVSACITSGYGMRWGRMHNGTDLGARHGTPIRAAAAGTVTVAWQSGAGNYTTINHGGGVHSVYMHQSRFAIRSGWVQAGQTIGYVGSTGNSTGPHLHLEVHTAGLWSGRVNPVGFFSARGVRLGC